jgi:hypothetical protein
MKRYPVCIEFTGIVAKPIKELCGRVNRKACISCTQIDTGGTTELVGARALT